MRTRTENSTEECTAKRRVSMDVPNSSATHSLLSALNASETLVDDRYCNREEVDDISLVFPNTKVDSHSSVISGDFNVNGMSQTCSPFGVFSLGGQTYDSIQSVISEREHSFEPKAKFWPKKVCLKS